MDPPTGYPESPSLDSDDIAYPCKGCGQVLEEGKAFELAGHRWHIDCFRCNTCGTLLDSDANLLLLGDGSLICNSCTYSCSACGNKIEDLAILTGDQAYCAGCFRCRNCKKKIENLRYARTTQGMFCMDCHDALMARRRKKVSKNARAKAGHSNTMLLDKSLPSLPPNAVNQSAFSPDQETMSDSYSESTPIELPGSTPTQSRTDSMGFSPPDSRHQSHSSTTGRRSELEDPGDGFFIPMALDPNPAPGPSPIRQSKYELDAEGTSLHHSDSNEFFGILSGQSSRKPSYVSTGERSQPQSPLVSSHEQGWDSNHEVAPRTSRRVEDSRREGQRDSGRQSREHTESGRFRLEEAPRRKKSLGSKRNSRGDNAHSRSDNAHLRSDNAHSQDHVKDAKTSSTSGPLRDISSNDQSPRSSSLNAPNVLSSRLSQDSRNEENGHRDSAKSSEMVLPKRGDSLQQTPTPTSTTNIPRKEVGSSSSRQNSTNQHDSNSDSAGPKAGSDSAGVNGGRIIGAPMESPVSKSTFDFQPRSKDRPGPVGEESFSAPRAAPQAPAESGHTRHRSRPSASSFRSESYRGEPGSPRNRDGDEEEAKVGQEEHSFLRRVSKSVRHARSHSDRAERNSRGDKWFKGSLHPGSLLEDRTSPIPSSPDAREDPSWLRQELRREREKSADLPKIEAELAAMRVELEESRKKTSQLERRKSEFEDVMDGKNAIKQMNSELREKRSTMVVLDTQKEIVVRELEVLTEHIASAKTSNTPLDMNTLSNAAMREFATSLQKLKESFTPQIEELTAQRIALADELAKLNSSRDKAQDEFRQLSAKNAQLMELNNNLVSQISHLHQAGAMPEGPHKPHGLGIYTHHHKDKSNLSIDSRNTEMATARGPSVADSAYSSTTLAPEGEAAESGAVVLNAPRVVNIRKEQPKKFNWKKGGTVAKGMTKGLKGAFSSNQQSPLPQQGGLQLGAPQLTEGMPYGAMSQNGELPTTILPGQKVPTPMEGPMSGGGRQGFGFFGQQKRGMPPQLLQQPKPGMGMNGGYLDEQPVHPSRLFGAELTSRADYERTVIPSIVTRCIQEVELRGMDQEGIYRKSGGAAQIQVIRDGFVADNDYDISDPDLDINAVTSCLKQYFRKLPTPLITFTAYDVLLSATDAPSDDARVSAMRAGVRELPAAHRDCLEFLVFHLARVIERDRENLMTAMNCAVVFAPTIMRPESIAREMTDTAAKNSAVQFLIENCYRVFEMGESGGMI